ncbi:MAG: nucleoside hydrolase [Alphaproteobacteria bacterium]
MMARTLIVDCDPGQDDAVALLLAFASAAELDPCAVTTVAGNAPLACTSRNARRVCELAERRDVPVHAGCARPILRPLETAEHVHGADGLAGFDLSEPTIPLAPGHAVDVLVERLMSADGDVTIAALGPLTNLALAIVKESRIVPRIREIVVMGGALGPGNVTAWAEFNLYVDPHAAAVVFSAGAALTMIGLDVTREAIATPGRVAAIRDIGRPAATAVATMLSLHLEPASERADAPGATLHDPCVIAYLLRPELFETHPMSIEVETADPERLGQTRVITGDTAPNANVAVGIDAEGFFRLLTERLARL